MTKKYPIAKLHKFLHSAPQFRPIQRGARRKGIERMYYNNDSTKSLKIMLFKELDIADQDLLLCLISMMVVEDKSTVISDHPKRLFNVILRDRLNLDGDVVSKMRTVATRFTRYEILKELGKTDAMKNYKWLEESLDRLAGVSFKYKTKTTIENFHLLSWCARLGDDGNISEVGVCINPYSAQAVLGDHGGYVLLHREERALLKKEDARALHAVFCGLVDMGRERVLKVDMLSDKVYSRYDEEVTDDVSRYRRAKLSRAILEIDDLDYWTCETIGKGRSLAVRVKRKKRK